MQRHKEKKHKLSEQQITGHQGEEPEETSGGENEVSVETPPQKTFRERPEVYIELKEVEEDSNSFQVILTTYLQTSVYLFNGHNFKLGKREKNNRFTH